MTSFRVSALLMCACLTSVLHAHPGHGDSGLGVRLLHVLTSHAPQIGLVGLLAVVAVLSLRYPGVVLKHMHVARRRRGSDQG